MTIAISTKIGEGLVYAADSTSSYFQNFETKDGEVLSRLEQSFHHARKLIQLRDYPVGILTYGLGQIASRNLESLVAEYERELKPFADGEAYTVEALAKGLHDFVKAKYDDTFPPPEPSLPDAPAAPDPRVDQGLRMGIIVGGFSSGAFHPDEWSITFPEGEVQQTDTSFGCRWWGVTAPLIRLILGYDPGLRQWFVKNGIDQGEVDSLIGEIGAQFQWPIYFHGMPVQDAIDLVVFLANVAIGHSRFVAGPPVCGGPVDVAVITHRGFTWVRRKQPSVKTDSIFF